MNISTKGRYGLRAILDIAMNGGGKPVTLSAIARRQHLSEGYLEQLMLPLKKAGLIVSTRGAQGGYYLARPAWEISAGEVFRALEGPLAVVSCVGEENSPDCERREVCGSAFIWSEVQQAISQVLDKYSVADLVEKEASFSDVKENCSG